MSNFEREMAAGEYPRAFIVALSLPPQDREAYLRWIEARAMTLPSAFLVPYAMYGIAREPEKALNWYYFARLRMQIDMARCENAQALAGLLVILKNAESSAAEFGNHMARGTAWRWALDQDARHPAPVLPGRDCWILDAIGGTILQSVRGVLPKDAKLLEKPPPLKPESQWPGLRDTVRADYERTMIRLFGDPSARPAAEWNIVQPPEFPLENLPGRYAPIPTGTPDDPFHVTELKGDGWRMLDSGAGVYSEGPFIWLDEKTLFFRGKNDSPKVTPDQRAKHKFGWWFFVWDIEKGLRRYRTYEEFGKAEAEVPCKLDNGVRIRLRPIIKDRKFVALRWLEGPLGHEREILEPVDTLTKSGIRARFSRLECRYVFPPTQLYGNIWSSLKPADGYLDFGSRRTHRGNTADLMTPGEQQPRVKLRRFNPDFEIELPIGIYQIRSLDIPYFSFKGAYFLYYEFPVQMPGGTYYHWSKFGCLPAWWLWRDGRTERLCIPSGPWRDGGSVSVYPTRKGLIVTARGDSIQIKPQIAGIYLETEGKLKKIAAGFVTVEGGSPWSNFSPTGCLVAFGYMPSLNLKQYERVRVLDVCASENGQKIAK